ncbi:hypothetical protein [Streptomyces sulphureus]|uniref:hypothetical protein n=1 Tax=Streptomyces sulphureus TaxID=47758 RepID=UPI00035DE49E|nr:hypothetical protein [Streptomyces sulphureus]
MRKTMIRRGIVVAAVVGLAAVPMAASVSAAPAAPAKGGSSSGASASADASFDVSFDALEVAKEIESSIKKAENREGFVKNLMNTAWYASGEEYNVVVRNLSQDYDEDLNGVQTYGSAEYDGVTYGIWIFEDGTFTNKGDGGWINWAMRGVFERTDEDGNAKEDGSVAEFENFS